MVHANVMYLKNGNNIIQECPKLIHDDPENKRKNKMGTISLIISPEITMVEINYNQCIYKIVSSEQRNMGKLMKLQK